MNHRLLHKGEDTNRPESAVVTVLPPHMMPTLPEEVKQRREKELEEAKKNQEEEKKIINEKKEDEEKKQDKTDEKDKETEEKSQAETEGNRMNTVAHYYSESQLSFPSV